MSRNIFRKPLSMAAMFAVLNVIMYLSIKKFWIGGSSFLPLVGQFGPGNKFLFALVVNLGVIIGSFVGARTGGEFRLRFPKAGMLPRVVFGGFLVGMGVTVCPGTCTTAFVTGMPMLSVSSVLSAAGIFIGSFIAYKITMGKD